jgi:hypothetical protein
MNAEMLADQDQALTKPCREPRCMAFVGELCINVATGKPLKHQAGHLVRLRDAGVELKPVDPRDLEDDGWPHRPHPQIPRAGA